MVMNRLVLTHMIVNHGPAVGRRGHLHCNDGDCTMATDEGSDTTSGDSKPGLEDLFSMPSDEEADSAREESADGAGSGSSEEAASDGGEVLGAEGGSRVEDPTDTGPADTAKPDRPTLPETDDDAEILEPETERTELSPEQVATRLTTGIDHLDRELEGGIPPGRMLSLVAPPETQSELLVKQMAIQRPTLYISTFRPEWEVKEELHDHLQKSDDPDLMDNEVQVEYVSPDNLLETPGKYIGNLQNGSNLIIDSINEFELEDRAQYVEFLNAVKEQLWDTGSVGLFYGIEEPVEPPARSLTLKRSDVVWQLERSVTNQDITTMLVISKFRGGKALTEPVKLVLTDEIQVDMSRDIG